MNKYITEQVDLLEKVLCNCGTSDMENHGNLCGYRYYGQQNVDVRNFLYSSLLQALEQGRTEENENIIEYIIDFLETHHDHEFKVRDLLAYLTNLEK